MTVLRQDIGQLPLAAARRAAIRAALLQAQTSEQTWQSLAQLQGPILVDDLCRLATLVDGQDISDAALACAAAESSPAISTLSRIIYGARLQLRAAGFVARKLAPPHTEPQTITCSSLESAFETLWDAGVATCRVPRQLLGNVRTSEERPAPLGDAVLRMLAAAYFGDTERIIRALCSAPYSIDPGNLGTALAGRREQKARDAVAAAVGALRGVEAKDAALAAVSALETAAPPKDLKEFSLAATLQSVTEAVMQGGPQSWSEPGNADLTQLRRAAASADRVWAVSPSAPDPALRVATLLDGYASVSISATLTLVPYGCSDVADGIANMRFDDSPGALILWDSFTAALDATEQQSRHFDTQLEVHITAALASSVATYLLSTTRVQQRRVWPQPESPVTLTAPPMTFSASRLNAFVKCPRRWFYEYLCEALEEPPSLHAAYGRVVHNALEALHREIRMPGKFSASVILEKLLRELDVAFGRSRADFASQLEYEVSRHRARRTADQYVRWLTQEAARAPLEIVDVEVQQRRRFGEHEFVGYIDRIDRPLGGGPITIFDYKTGRIDTDAAAYLERVRRGDEAQLALYYAMRRESGDDISRIALVSIRDPRDDVWILALDIVDDDGKAIVEREPVDGVLRATCSRADLDASLAALIERCNVLTLQGLDHFPAGDDPPCNFCAYARACRERPEDGERIFAR